MNHYCIENGFAIFSGDSNFTGGVVFQPTPTETNPIEPMSIIQRNQGITFKMGDHESPSNVDRLMVLASVKPEEGVYSPHLQMYGDNAEIYPLYPGENENHRLGRPTNRWNEIFVDSIDTKEVTVDGQTLDEYILSVVNQVS